MVDGELAVEADDNVLWNDTVEALAPAIPPMMLPDMERTTRVRAVGPICGESVAAEAGESDPPLLKGRLPAPGGTKNDMLDGVAIKLEGELLLRARGDSIRIAATPGLRLPEAEAAALLAGVNEVWMR